jgi:hypothetical protein
VIALASLFRVRFMCAGAVYWVVAGQPTTDGTISRLGLLV